MKYCSYCGAQMEENDRFCSKCGADDSGEGASVLHAQAHAPQSEREPKEKLGRELAYCGFLFWLPMVLCPKEKYTRFCANQGLWALITATVACVAIRLLGALNALLSDIFLIGIVYGAVYCLIYIVFLMFMFYLVWKCFQSAMAIHRGEKPESILFFDDIRLIREYI